MNLPLNRRNPTNNCPRTLSIIRFVSCLFSSRRSSKSQECYENPFSSKRCIALFHEYTSESASSIFSPQSRRSLLIRVVLFPAPDEPDVLGPEGMEKFCEDISVEPENVFIFRLYLISLPAFGTPPPCTDVLKSVCFRSADSHVSPCLENECKSNGLFYEIRMAQRFFRASVSLPDLSSTSARTPA